jgi:transmembrane sensor
MSTGVSTTFAIRESAVHWCMRLEGEVSDADREEFHRWLLADPRHEAEYLAVVSMTSALSDVSRETGQALVVAPPLALPAVPMAAPQPEVRRKPWLMALAASVAAAAIVAAGWIYLPQSGLTAKTFETATGKTQTVTFDDGSVVYMNTRTRLKWFGAGSERRVALLEGEALFDVAHDEKRPFYVELDNSEIQVRGTRFNVYRKKTGDVVVTVLEGTVDVQELGERVDRPAWKRELHADQRIVYRPIGLIQDVHPTEAREAVKWRDGVLEIADEPLENVLEELTRYTDRRIVIQDPRIAGLPIGGALSTRDVRAALDRIAAFEPAIRVDAEGDQFTLSLRPGMQPRGLPKRSE